ncbi:MAG TPA: Uma2 family endonuclease [Anaerolineae bacterium]|nr:Uma2 family endonuclease [Anaerolineae bacterium]HIQ05162.1 Uma2 family endonuclease [Anaerolineae bacterium]
MGKTDVAQPVLELKTEEGSQERFWPPAQGEWTYEDYLRLPDDGWRYEVIRGVLRVVPAPREIHQRVSGGLFVALWSFVRDHQLGRVYEAPFEVILSDIATPVQPDILFISAERIEETITPQRVEGAPDLIVEILSPGNWLDDRREKFRVYEESGVREYWIVDPDGRVIEVFVLREGGYTLLGKWGSGEVARSEVLVGFEVAVDELFAG